MDLSTLLLIASSIVAVITGVTEVLKRSFGVSTRFVPVISIAVGIAVGIALQPVSQFNLYTMILSGFLAGLSSCGLFDLVINTSKKDKN